MVDTDLGSCIPASRAHAVEQLAALTCATTAQALQVIAIMDRAEDHRLDGALDMASWLVATLHVSVSTARSWVRVARALEQLPCLQACFASGRMSFDQIAAATKLATPETDDVLADRLPGCSAAEIEAMAQQHRRRTRRDAQRTHDHRHLVWRKDLDTDGYHYRGFLPGPEAAIVNAALEARAERMGPDAATGLWAPFEQRCADALVEMGRQDLTDNPGPDPTLVVVHVDAESLAADGAGNGTLDTDVQIPFDTMWRLLCDTAIELNVDGPDGTCVGVGRAQRTPPRWLRRRIQRRDQGHCRFPGCGRKIRQVHHIEWWHRDHGPTDSWNLVGLCWAHHHLVHEGGWTIEGNADQQLTFSSPHGRTLSSRPPPLLSGTRQRIHQITDIDLGPDV
jgi:hypothetical protein